MSWETVCTSNDIVINAGRAALIDGEQVAIFRVAAEGGEKFYALSNYCPFSKANVLSRGIVGSLDGQLVVASPIYKEHFNLETGVCLEDSDIVLKTWKVKEEGGEISVAVAEEVVAA